MKRALTVCVCLLAGCSARTAQESAETREFKEAVRKFVADCRVVANAWERDLDSGYLNRYIDQATDSYTAIPPRSDRPGKAILADAGKLKAALHNDDYRAIRLLADELGKSVEAVK